MTCEEEILSEKQDIRRLGTRVCYFPQSRLPVDAKGVLFKRDFFFLFTLEEQAVQFRA